MSGIECVGASVERTVAALAWDQLEPPRRQRAWRVEHEYWGFRAVFCRVVPLGPEKRWNCWASGENHCGEVFVGVGTENPGVIIVDIQSCLNGEIALSFCVLSLPVVLPVDIQLVDSSVESRVMGVLWCEGKTGRRQT